MELNRSTQLGLMLKGTGEQTWLEMLSEATCRRICCFVARGRACEELLHFIEACPSLHEAAMSVVDYSVVMVNSMLSESRRWLTTCGASLREVVITGKLDDESLGRQISQLRIDRCNIETTNRSSLDFIRFFTSIEELAIMVCRWPNVTFLFQALNLLRLEKLEIFCCCSYEPSQYDDPPYVFAREDECIFYRKAICGSEFNAFAISCPNLRVFATNVCSCGTRYGSRVGFPFLKGFQRLEEYFVTGDIPLSFFSHMPSITKVNIEGSEDATSVHYFGTALAGLSTCDVLSRTQIARLKSCINLKELDIALEEGAEVALPQLVACLPCLKKLDLCWTKFSLQRGMPVTETLDYATATPEIMLQTIRAAPKLTALYLDDVQLSLNELEAMLENIGDRLEFFRTPLLGQEEDLIERWEAVVCLLVKHCPNLKYLYVDSNTIKQTPSTRRTRGNIQRLERAMLCLGKRLPMRRTIALDVMAEELRMAKDVLPPQ